MKKERLMALVLGSVLGLNGCSLKAKDYSENYNVMVEVNEEVLSVIVIESFVFYHGEQMEVKTKDGLVILTNVLNTQLLRVESEEQLKKYMEVLGHDKIIKAQIDDVDYQKISNNEEAFNEVFNKALILNQDEVVVLDIVEFVESQNHDKIEVTLSDGLKILVESNNCRLLNDLEASQDSTHNYAKSLVKSEDKINYYNSYSLRK